MNLRFQSQGKECTRTNFRPMLSNEKLSSFHLDKKQLPVLSSEVSTCLTSQFASSSIRIYLTLFVVIGRDDNKQLQNQLSRRIQKLICYSTLSMTCLLVDKINTFDLSSWSLQNVISRLRNEMTNRRQLRLSPLHSSWLFWYQAYSWMPAWLALVLAVFVLVRSRMVCRYIMIVTSFNLRALHFVDAAHCS